MRAIDLSLAILLVTASSASPAQPGDPAALIRVEREAMERLSWMNGRWQGPAWSQTPAGRHEIVQTERIGPMLDGSVKVVEGKSFERDGRPAAFNAFGIIYFDPGKKVYRLHSHAQGRSGDFPMEVTADGYVWTIAAGPVSIRYAAIVRDGVWREVGEMVRPDGNATQIFEMNLRRTGDSDWPLAGQATVPH